MKNKIARRQDDCFYNPVKCSINTLAKSDTNKSPVKLFLKGWGKGSKFYFSMFQKLGIFSFLFNDCF
jgi:hypothetical protein